MNNSEIASIFFEMADILEMQNVEWKPRAYRDAARSVDSLKKDVSDIYSKGGLKALEEIPGIGEHLGRKIEEYIKTGKIKAYLKLRKSAPSHISVLVKIPGMGPKKVKKLNSVLKITNVAGLAKAAKQGKIRGIEGFGEKSEQDILEGIALMKKSKTHIPYSQALRISKGIVVSLKKVKEVKQISVAGSLRRKKAVIGDIDILVSSLNAEKVISAFTKIKQIKKILAKGVTKVSVILKNGVQVDLRVLLPSSWGAGLFYFTGSKSYNILMRKEAIKKGLKLSEYGLFKSGKMIAGKTEKEICKKLGVKFLKPEQRSM